MSDPAITPELVQKHGLTPEEYQMILDILGRPPTYTELGIFSVMWSEHCSYKNTRPLLKTFPTQSCCILVGAGEENAGIVDIGDGLAIAFKMESHNHPSAVEPFQGAATGVGGIIRDIFTMGARPICALDSLRFGELSKPAVKRLFSGVVSGIAHYGNCFGIPTVGGEVYFDKSFEGNPLVNVFALGVLRHEQIARGKATGVGNPVFYVGPATGRDGLAGAAFASQDLTEESAEQQRGAVQVGDPFMEKLLVEACLELLATDAVAGIQDMGAAGLTCSTCETAARAGTGIEIELDRVPQRAPNMSAYEIMLSESQERMLIIVKKGREAEVQRIFDKWDLPWAQIGVVTDTGRMVVKHHGQVVADIPAAKLANDAPVYHRESRPPAYFAVTRAFTPAQLPDTTQPMAVLKKLLAWPTIASKNWVYRQYDHMVRNGTVVLPGSDAAVVRLKEDCLPVLPAGSPAAGRPVPEKYLALTSDCNAAYVYLDPYEGGKAAVAEAARNLACSGARPLGVTDNLNFGNPHNPELFYQLKEAVRGVAEACRVFDAPVTGGNCSLYNQSPDGPIDPTPTVAMVGIIEKREHITTQWFKTEGDAILLLGDPLDAADPCQGLGGSAYLLRLHRKKLGTPPPCDLAREKRLHDTLRELIAQGWVRSAHDCSEGGLAVCLAECCMSRREARGHSILLGAEVDLTPWRDARQDALWFGEAHGRVVISCAPEHVEALEALARSRGVPVHRLGVVKGQTLKIKTAAGTHSARLSTLHDLWWNALDRAMSA
ncbi:phosphoribosylformylglycinamidine synthase subunit PurL [Fontisphaera persica]|uniref:phosphoribosylformylglycinamidine synthase subunit PurL n=1 Tax=Fontisphaera persica TaxID=2974023 RepID=UPI0024C0AABC|nr:phosphoribosylformylglycinamidine synthase subunit PurL [Fontisphaera persica]WCJ59254.1 phosphoribosylformylglycinamidine synthase subunit PurL [Fontisphaera persica]